MHISDICLIKIQFSILLHDLRHGVVVVRNLSALVVG